MNISALYCKVFRVWTAYIYQKCSDVFKHGGCSCRNARKSTRVCMYVCWPLDVHVINELSVYLCKRTNICVFSSHKCFYIEKLNLNPEKCNKTAKYQQYQCVWWVLAHQSNIFFPPTLDLSADKGTEHVDKAMWSCTLCC